MLALIASLTIFFLSGFGKSEREGKPNVIFILVDDLGWKDVGVFGSEFYQTPHVDNLASDGILFNNAYASCTVCSPTRASIMSGKYPANLNCTDWIEGWKYPNAKLKVPDWTMYLPQEEVTMAELFRDAGYATGHFGKWHLGGDEKYWPENQGFEINVGGWKKGSPNRNKKQGYNGYFAPFGNPRINDKPDDNYLTDRLANEACEFIEKNHKRPFFLNLWFYNVHTPLQASADKIKKYGSLKDPSLKQQNPAYAAMVEHMDDAVGMVIEKLKDLNLYDNAIIVFTSDNGGLIGGKRKVTSNYPLRSGKGDMYEGGVRVPLIFKMVDNANAGYIDPTPVISPDFLPTLMSLTKIQASDKVCSSWDGKDLSSLLYQQGEQLNRETIYWHYPHYHNQGATPYSAVRHGDWKLIHIVEDEIYELYNLKTDIGEGNDLSKKYPEIVSSLKRELENWKKEMKAQMPEANPEYNADKSP